MDSKFQSSFLPKQPIAAPVARYSSSVSIISVVASVVFILALALGIGTYIWTNILNNDIVALNTTLEKSRAALHLEDITELKRTSTRIESAQEVLNNHFSFSSFFDFLNASTYRSVSFTDFSYKFNQTTNQLALSLKGQASSFNALTLQSDLFQKAKAITNPIFSDLSLDQGGNVLFTLTASLDPALVLYRNSLPPPPQEETSTEDTSASATTPDEGEEVFSDTGELIGQ